MAARRWATLALGIAAGWPASALGAPTKQECVAAFEDGQKLRAKGALTEALRNFQTCAEGGCPDLTKVDCTKWLSEVEGSLPTLSFAVVDGSGKDVSVVRVTVDGKPVLERLDGKALAVDPGPHQLLFEAPAQPPLKVEIVVREGEKNRRVEVRLGASEPPRSGKVSPATWALGAVGLVGLSVFGVLGGLGLSEKSDAETSCSPGCSDDVVGSIRTKFIAADVALTIGLLSLGAGVAVGLGTYFGSRGDARAHASLVLSPAWPSGALVSLRGLF